MKNVCIIGAGVSGLVLARHLKSSHHITVLESSSAVGGVWIDNGSTPMYKNLQTNLPLQVMQFSGFNYPPQTKQFPTHPEILAYLEAYNQHHDLESLIRFQSKATSVAPKSISENTPWLVTTDGGKTEQFDSVAICTGRYRTAHIPKIKGMDTFRNTVIHSKSYYDPSDYHNKHVLVVGCGNSGMDISLDLWKHGVNVSVSHRQSLDYPGVPCEIQQFPEIKCASAGSVIFKNNELLQPDVILFATGYGSNLDFLSERCSIDTSILPFPLYKYFINCKFPNLAIFDQCNKVAPFILSEYQSLYFKDVLSGKIVLPKYEERLFQAMKLWERYPDAKAKYKYTLGEDQFNYYRDLDTEVLNYDLHSLQQLYNFVVSNRDASPLTYRDIVY